MDNFYHLMSVLKTYRTSSMEIAKSNSHVELSIINEFIIMSGVLFLGRGMDNEQKTLR